MPLVKVGSHLIRARHAEAKPSPAQRFYLWIEEVVVDRINGEWVLVRQVRRNDAKQLRTYWIFASSLENEARWSA